MPLPNTNTRPLKRLANGHFTMKPLREAQVRDSLCDSCGRIYCPIQEAIDDKLAEHIHANILTCAKFAPVLTFSVLDGLDLPEWNTIRIGEAWKKRLEPGHVVAIANPKEDRIVRYMRVARVEAGVLKDVVEEHAAFNHAILAKPEGVPAERLMKILKNAYGSNFAAPDRKATAIYLVSNEAEAQKGSL